MSRQEIMNEIRKETGNRYFVRNFNVSYEDKNARQVHALDKMAYDLATDITTAKDEIKV